MMRIPITSVLFVFVAIGSGAARALAGDAAPGAKLFSRDNLVPWCIVPYDGKKRSPEDRAAMLERLGFTHYAYDWRAEHLPTFETEIESLQKHHVELTAVWFPGGINADARFILGLLAKHHLKPQLWVAAAIAPAQGPGSDEQNLAAAAAVIRPIAEEAAKIGCTVALYNHGGWFGEPENQLAVIARLNLPSVGMVYNLHHGHDQVARFKTFLPQILPHLWCVTLNGMVKDGDKIGKMVLPIGRGDQELELLKTLRASGYRGRIAILNHTNEDAEGRLRDNLDGLDWLVAQLDGAKAGPKPTPRTYREAGKAAPSAEQPGASATPSALRLSGD